MPRYPTHLLYKHKSSLWIETRMKHAPTRCGMLWHAWVVLVYVRQAQTTNHSHFSISWKALLLRGIQMVIHHNFYGVDIRWTCVFLPSIHVLTPYPAPFWWLQTVWTPMLCNCVIQWSRSCTYSMFPLIWHQLWEHYLQSNWNRRNSEIFFGRFLKTDFFLIFPKKNQMVSGSLALLNLCFQISSFIVFLGGSRQRLR